MSKLSLYDIVKITEAVPGLNICVGSTGTVIDELAGGSWLVEFDDIEDASGFPVALGFTTEKLVLVKAFSAMKPAPTLTTVNVAKAR